MSKAEVYLILHFLSDLNVGDQVLFDDEIFDHLSFFRSDQIQAFVMSTFLPHYLFQESLNGASRVVNKTLVLLV